MPATKISTKWVSGNLVFLDKLKRVVATWDGQNRKLSFPSGSILEVDGVQIGSAVIADVTASAAELNKLDGSGAVVASGTQAVHVADAKVNYGAGDLDSEAEIITAVNLANTKINSILAALEAFGINASV